MEVLHCLDGLYRLGIGQSQVGECRRKVWRGPDLCLAQESDYGAIKFPDGFAVNAVDIDRNHDTSRLDQCVKVLVALDQ